MLDVHMWSELRVMSEMTLDVVDEVFSARRLWHCSVCGEVGQDAKKGTRTA